MAKMIRSCFALVASIVLLSTVIFASVNDLAWVGFLGDTATIAKGDSVGFDVAVASFEPGAVYNIGLYDSNDNLVRSLRSGVVDGSGLYSETITLTPADYGNIGGIFYVNIQSSEGTGLQYRIDIDELDLVITQSAPLVFDIPDFTIEEGDTYTIDLNEYVFDSDDLISSLTWTVIGNTNLAVSIDANNIATITAPLGWTGSETLTFVATDPSGDSGFDDAVATVISAGSSEEEVGTMVNVKELNIESFGDGMLMVRNNGKDMEDVKIEIDIEASNAPENTFKRDIDSNTVRYLDLNTQGLSGDYLAKVKVTSDDSSASGYIIVSI